MGNEKSNTGESTAGGITGLLQGKCGLIMGVANDRSIAWGIARMAAGQGAKLALSYQGEALKRRIEPLAAQINASPLLVCDILDDRSIEEAIARIGEAFGRIDFLVHAIAFSDRNELMGNYINTSRENFLNTMNISCYSLTAMARAASTIMNEYGSILTLSYYGAEKVIPHYNVMGVAKAALEASVRYLAADLGERGIRVNAISAGPVRTLAASGIGDFRKMLKWGEVAAPLRRNITPLDVGASAAYLLSDLSRGVTGEIHYVDAGYNITGLAPLEQAEILAGILKGSEA